MKTPRSCISLSPSQSHALSPPLCSVPGFYFACKGKLHRLQQLLMTSTVVIILQPFVFNEPSCCHELHPWTLELLYRSNKMQKKDVHALSVAFFLTFFSVLWLSAEGHDDTEQQRVPCSIYERIIRGLTPMSCPILSLSCPVPVLPCPIFIQSQTRRNRHSTHESFFFFCRVSHTCVAI